LRDERPRGRRAAEQRESRRGAHPLLPQ
jgi:hypothetical protein